MKPNLKPNKPNIPPDTLKLNNVVDFENVDQEENVDFETRRKTVETMTVRRKKKPMFVEKEDAEDAERKKKKMQLELQKIQADELVTRRRKMFDKPLKDEEDPLRRLRRTPLKKKETQRRQMTPTRWREGLRSS